MEPRKLACLTSFERGRIFRAKRDGNLLPHCRTIFVLGWMWYNLPMNFEPVELVAGPVRLKLADGELRYLTVGTTEIIRRVFFAVRTRDWDTVTPRFDSVDIVKRKDSFSVRLKATCKGLGDVNYSWSGEIEGKPSGEITFRAVGVANAAMQSNRIGLCVLFGTPTVCSQEYTVLDKSGKSRIGQFPTPVNAPLMFEPEFTELKYRSATASVSGSAGTLFSMEDQRNFGDASFKAYAPLPYAYPECKEGETHEETITIRPGAAPTTALPKGTRVTFGGNGPITGRVPQLKSGSPSEKIGFYDVNHSREKYKNNPALSFVYFPIEHLFDDDTCWENVPVILDMVASARKACGEKPVDLNHIALDPSHARPTRDPRNASAFGAAWSAACVKYAALAGVRSATFDLGPGHSARILSRLGALGGLPLQPAKVVSGALTPPVDGFQVGPVLVLWNRTAQRQPLTLSGVAPGSYLAESFDGTTAPSAPPTRGKLGGATLTLNPYEVRLLTPRTP